MADEELEFFECLLCSEPIQCFGVFNCGHFLCDTCALRMRTFPGANANMMHASPATGSVVPTYRGASRTAIDALCPVCRAPVRELILTSEPPPSDDAYPPDLVQMLSDRSIPTGACHARLDGDLAKVRVGLLVGFLCPNEECWQPDPATGNPSQEPFVSFDVLREHLKTDHRMRYCKQCLDYRPAFLSEQRAYTDAEMDQHHRGRCQKDPGSFVGHPPCLFCGQRFYEGDALLKHMIQGHVTCDLCNQGEFIFVFYKNHEMLAKHFQQQHHVCKHRDCQMLSIMERVFNDEFALHAHMVRAHGEKQQLSVASLGFNFSASPSIPGLAPGAGSSGGRGSPQPAGARGANPSSGPANAANTHADRITFDFCDGRLEDVFSTPRRDSDNSGKKGKRQQQQRGTGSQDEVRGGLAGTNTGENLPDLRKRLNEMLALYLPAPSAQELMRSYSRAFIDGSAKATEYFKNLQSLLPDPDALNAVFAPLVATLPDPTKREALTAAKTMLTSAEAVRHKKNQDETDAQRRLEEARRQGKEKRQQMQQASQSSARQGAAKAAAPKGAWTKSAATVGNTTAAPPSLGAAPSHHHSGPDRRAGGPQPGRGGVWGGSAAAAPTGYDIGSGVAYTPAHLDPESFPTLGGSGPGAAGGGGRKGGSATRGATKPLPKSVWGARR